MRGKEIPERIARIDFPSKVNHAVYGDVYLLGLKTVATEGDIEVAGDGTFDGSATSHNTYTVLYHESEEASLTEAHEEPLEEFVPELDLSETKLY